MRIYDTGIEYLDALSAAREAHHKFVTNNGDTYDPCSYTSKQCAKELDEATLRLGKAVKALTTLV